MTHPTTPDQGDERRAIHEWLMREHKIEVLGNPEDDTAAVIGLGTLRNIARVAMSAAPRPVAQPVVDQEPESMSDNGSCGSQVSGKPVSAEAGKGVDAGERVKQLMQSHAGRIYIAGPMTGLPEFNFPAFNAKAAELRAEGWHVENPAEHGHVAGAKWSDYLRYDLTRIATCEAVYLLPGWSVSKGATLEVQVASALGMQIIGESVAVSGEDWHEPRQLIAGARERANMVATEGSEARLAEFTRAVLALDAPMPQPERTSKGEPRVVVEVCPECDIADCKHIRARRAASQQREPQEAAHEAASEDHVEDEVCVGRCGICDNVAPQEASKPQVCGYPACGCNPKHCPLDESKEASKVEPVADEPFGWFYEMDRKANPKAGPVYLGGNDQKIVRTVADDEGATAFPLYLRPSQQALSDAHVRAAGGIVHRDGNIFFTNIAQLNAAILAAAGGSEK